ncbi:UNKNOWN [Stylonychia lemnae]|uniref:Transmembrane protein n=1 Tax=Stylonychia lemnae TaxID=5949 RepID=A0A077ZVI9_STYLE|nr:UNKNOWN [Stylonychia lemnae]|eukprot:CDW73874.1 UNKNOWN [Stylonychia lemnae]
MLDCIGYAHEGYKISNDGVGLFGQQDQAYQVSKFRQQDIIYVNKDREQGLKELSQIGRKIQLSYTILMLAFAIAVFTYVQYIVYSYANECKARTPVLYVWLICEIIIFYTSLCLFLTFGSYYAWRSSSQLQSKLQKYRNRAADKRDRLEFL